MTDIADFVNWDLRGFLLATHYVQSRNQLTQDQHYEQQQSSETTHGKYIQRTERIDYTCIMCNRHRRIPHPTGSELLIVRTQNTHDDWSSSECHILNLDLNLHIGALRSPTHTGRSWNRPKSTWMEGYDVSMSRTTALAKLNVRALSSAHISGHADEPTDPSPMPA